MIAYFRENREFVTLMLLWLLVGLYGDLVIYGLLPLTIFLLKKKDRYIELILGFWFILILSDSRYFGFGFATDLKVIYAVLLGLIIFFNMKVFQPINQLYRKFVPFFIVAFYCLLYSEDFVSNFQKTVSYLLIIFIVPNMIVMCFREQKEAFLRSLVWFAASILLVGLVLRYLMPDFVHIEGRFSGIFGNPNGVGVFSVLTYFLFRSVNHLFPESFTRVDRIIIIALIAISILFCGSRGAILALLIFMFFNIFYKISRFLGFIILLFFMVSYQLIENNLAELIFYFNMEEYLRLETLEAGSGRKVARQFIWEKIQDNFFLGNGIGSTEYVFEENYNMLSRLGHQGNAHNSYLTLWMDTGLIGLLLYFYGFIGAFLLAVKRNTIVMPILYSILAMIFVESWLTASLNPFTIVVFIILTILSSHEIQELAKQKAMFALKDEEKANEGSLGKNLQ